MKKHEKSEIHMLYVRIYKAQGQFETAVNHLIKKKNEIVDHVLYNEMLAELYKKLGNTEK